MIWLSLLAIVGTLLVINFKVGLIALSWMVNFWGCTVVAGWWVMKDVPKWRIKKDFDYEYECAVPRIASLARFLILLQVLGFIIFLHFKYDI